MSDAPTVDTAQQAVADAADAVADTAADAAESVAAAAEGAAESAAEAGAAAADAAAEASGKLADKLGIDWEASKEKLSAGMADFKNIVLYPLVTGVMTVRGWG